MNNSQGVPSGDNSTTCVIFRKDPGIYDRLDPRGFGEVILTHRRQALPTALTDEGPAISGRLVKLDALDRTPPQGMKRADSAGRARQIDERRRGVARRFTV